MSWLVLSLAAQAAPPDTGVSCDLGASIVINELVNDPAGVDSSADAEWVELYNGSKAAVDVSGWTLEVATSGTPAVEFTFAEGTVIAAGDFVVIGEALAPSVDYFAPAALNLGNATSNADTVQLVDCAGTIVDTVVYGAPNTDKWLDDTGAVATSLAPTPPSNSGQAIARLTDGFDTDLSGDDFEVLAIPTPGDSNASGPTDCGGPGSGVVINEFLANPAGTDGDAGTEFVELYNAGPGEIELDDWAVVTWTTPDNSTTQFTFEPGMTIEPGAYLLYGDFAVPGAETVSLSLPSGSNGDLIAVVDCFGIPADIVAYGEDNDDGVVDESGKPATSMAPKPGDDEVLARISDGYDTNLSRDDFIASLDATPGTANPEYEPVECIATDGSITINEVFANPKGDDGGFEWVELHNATGAAVSVAGWSLALGTNGENQDELDVTLPGGTEVPASGFLVIGGSKVAVADVLAGSLSIPNGTDGDSVRLVDCDGTIADTLVYGSNNKDMVTDDSGAVATSLAPSPGDAQVLARVQDGYDTDDCGSDFLVLDTPTPGAPNPDNEPVVCEPSDGSVVLNEVMANPDGSDTDMEWIELFNTSSQPKSIAGWGLVIANNGDAMGDLDASFPGAVTVPANGYLLIGDVLVGPPPDLQVSMSIGNGTSGDAVQLVDCEGTAVDTLVYGSNNKDGVTDDSGQVATSLAAAPGDGQSLARIQDGWDTDDCAYDWVLNESPTPGSANPDVEPVVCVPGNESAVVINELLADPDGEDGGFEWIELYNPSGTPISVAGWGIVFAGQADDFVEPTIDVELPGGTEIAAGGFLLVGDEFITDADVIAAMSIGNGSGGDGAQLLDCEGTRIDTVAYGDDNEDGILDDNGEAVDPPAPEPGSMQSLARIEDGGDTNHVEDWFVDATPTPGASNFQEEIVVPEPEVKGGCFGRGGTPDGESPKGCGGNQDVPSEKGCATMPLPLSGLEIFAGVVAFRRRRSPPRSS